MISMVESDRKALRFDGVVRAALTLDTSTDYLAGLTDDPTPVNDRVREAEERAQEAEARIRREEARNRQQLEAALERTEEELERLRARVGQVATDGLTDETAIADPGVYQMETPEELSGIETMLSRLGLRLAPWRRQVQAAAGVGAIVGDETVEGYLVFHEWWLRKHGIRDMSVIEVSGDSMASTLENGDAILVDHQRTRRLRGRIFVVHTEDGVVVKRLARDGDDWLLVSDNEDQQEHPPVPWPDDAKVVGQVLWTGRTL